MCPEERKETYDQNNTRGFLLNMGFPEGVKHDNFWFWRLPNLLINKIKDRNYFRLLIKEQYLAYTDFKISHEIEKFC